MSLALAVLASGVWTLLIAATLADGPGFAGTAATARILLRTTDEGHVLLLQWAALAGDAPALARRRMRRSLARETMIGLLVVLAAGVLASLPPSVEMAVMHANPMAEMGGAHGHVQK